jgi:hypothetical protein
MQVNSHAVRNHRGWTIGFCQLTVIVALSVCATANAQTLVGSSGAGWQTWTVTPISSSQPDLNDNGAPWWDMQWNAAGAYGNSTTADKNPGFCITATADCVGYASGAFAPGAIPFWAFPYDSVADDPAGGSPGARDNTVFFRSTGGTLRATLFLNPTANANEVNDFGWFETNSSGTYPGRKHKLFSGTGVTKDHIPTPTGTTVSFTPTRYFGFYYSDVSEPACPNGHGLGVDDPTVDCVGYGANPPIHGCYAYSIFSLNDQKCVEATGNQGDHDFVIFSANATSSTTPTYWVVGEDPADCAVGPDGDGDCNQTVVRISH